MTPLTPICSDPLHTLAPVLVPVLFFSKGNPLEDSLELKADTGTCFCGWLLRNQTNMVSTGPEAASAWRKSPALHPTLQEGGCGENCLHWAGHQRKRCSQSTGFWEGQELKSTFGDVTEGIVGLLELQGTQGKGWGGRMGGVWFRREIRWGCDKLVMTAGVPYLDLEQWLNWTGMCPWGDGWAGSVVLWPRARHQVEWRSRDRCSLSSDRAGMQGWESCGSCSQTVGGSPAHANSVRGILTHLDIDFSCQKTMEGMIFWDWMGFKHAVLFVSLDNLCSCLPHKLESHDNVLDESRWLHPGWTWDSLSYILINCCWLGSEPVGHLFKWPFYTNWHMVSGVQYSVAK